MFLHLRRHWLSRRRQMRYCGTVASGAVSSRVKLRGGTDRAGVIHVDRNETCVTSTFDVKAPPLLLIRR